ncbi:MAG: isoleucine--tRNA ligase [Longimicrobiaceae bacterium]
MSRPDRFPELPPDTAALEEEVLSRWSGEGTFARSLEKTAGGEPFVFYEGPPTANGRPGLHHVFSRTIKDTVARFHTMRGRHVTRIAGWDTHGLPVEIETEKRLGISGKPEIEELGVARFNQECRESVLAYTDEWERFSARLGYWLDYSRPYVTYHPDYIESVWWILSRIHQRGLLYRGYKVLPYCPRCGTGLSSHELALGYREVADPSLYVKFHLLDDPDAARILSWTTTPWTLPGNLALAVGEEIGYLKVRVTGGGEGNALAKPGEVLILARERAGEVLRHGYQVLEEFPGRALVGLRYRPLFPGAVEAGGSDRAWTVLPASFVTVDEGTGVVHTAVMYGEDDFELGARFGLPTEHTVNSEGRFVERVPGGLAGRRVLDPESEPVVTDWLRGHDFLYRREVHQHSYPHCWRCGSPLLYMARDSWFIRTTGVRDQLLNNNQRVSWYPPEVGSGRFGEWLENNVDWAISRDRYWGTPLPVWVCDREVDHLEVIGSFAELAERAGPLPDNFDPHRPLIDEYSWPCPRPGCGGRARRTPEVIDVWFDSGAMPYAQWHHPFENQAEFERHFPADFICEGVDQTRGWFYSLMAISTLLGLGPAYRNVIVNDLILDAQGQKMSKSRGNVVDPWRAFADHGADAIRWYLLAGSNPWLPKRFDPEGVREVERKLFATLRNSYNFFALYANLEGWVPREDHPPPAERPVLDRWLLSRLASVSRLAAERVRSYDLTHAVRAIGDFVVDDLSNWYVRRSRDRFWGSADQAGTRAAFATLHEALVTVARLMAPFAPFFPDWLHRALTGESVHLAGFPAPAGLPDRELEEGMEAARALAGLGRAAREKAGLRVRQPLATLHAVLPGGRGLDGALVNLLKAELNVKRVELADRAEELVTLSARPDFRALGARFGARTPEVAKAIRELSSDALAAHREGQLLSVEVEGEKVALEDGDFELEQTVSAGRVAEHGGGYTAVLDPTVTPELRAEGLARELVNRVQRLRREAGLEVSERIELVVGGDGGIRSAVERYRDFVAGETLATRVSVSETPLESGRYQIGKEVDLDGITATISLRRSRAE